MFLELSLRRLIFPLLCLVLLIRVSLPHVVCVSMGGQPRLVPCCEREESPAAPAWTAACCEQAQAPALADQGLPRPAPHADPSPSLVALLPVALLAPVRHPAALSRAWSGRGPPDLPRAVDRIVLRI